MTGPLKIEYVYNLHVCVFHAINHSVLRILGHQKKSIENETGVNTFAGLLSVVKKINSLKIVQVGENLL